MAKSFSARDNLIFRLFAVLVFATLLVPLLFSSQLIYPFVSTKALFFRAVILLALPLYLYLLIKSKAYRPSFKNPLTLALAAFVLLSLVSGFFGVNPGRSFWGNYERMDGTYNLLHLFLLYLYLLLLFSAREALGKKFLIAGLWVAGAVCAYGLLEKLGITFFQDASLPARASSTFGNPIYFGSFATLPIFLAAFFALGEGKGWKRNFYWLVAALGFAALLVSAARGAVLGVLLAVLAMGFVYVIFSGKKKLKVWGISLLAVLAAVFLVVFFLGRHASGSSLARIFNLNDSNAKARLIQWQSGLKGFKDHPLLGVGPQNYGVIANTYFNPEIYKYDSTWFDKPHNYPLEILLTNGIAGLLAYAAMVYFCFWAFWRAYKKGLIAFLEFCLLSAGMLAYQIQNLFAFDTTSAAWIFFVYFAFSAYLWDAAGEPSKAEPALGKSGGLLAPLTAAAAAILALYIVFVTDIVTARVLYNLNIAYALGLKDPKNAERYFEAAENQSFLYDLGDVAVRHSEFAVAVGQDLSATLEPNFVHGVLAKATAAMEKTTQGVKNNPIYWYHLANDYDTFSIIDKTPVDPKAQTAVDNAIALAPSRVEPKFFLVQIYGLQKNIPEVVRVSEEIEREVPFFPEAKWRLALAYKDANRLPEAVAMANQALDAGYQFKLAKEVEWLINYYADQQDYARVAGLYEAAIKLSPSNYQLYASLATVYAKLGEKDKAIAAANKVLELNPASRDSVEAFLKTLQ